MERRMVRSVFPAFIFWFAAVLSCAALSGCGKTANSARTNGAPNPGVPPVVQTDENTAVDEQAPFTLSGTATPAAGAQVISYSWTQTDGPRAVLIGSSQNTSASFVAPRVEKETKLTFLLTATDNTGARGTAESTIEITPINTPPVIQLSELFSTTSNTLYRLEAIVTDPDNDDMTFEWRQISGPAVTIESEIDDKSLSFTTPVSNTTTRLGFEITATDTQGGISRDSTFVDVVPAPESVPAAVIAIPGKLETENYKFQRGVRADDTSDIGGGKHLGLIENGDYTLYEIEVESEGQYEVSLRYSTPRSSTVVSLRIGEDYVGEVPLGSTDGWENWTTTNALLDFPAGKHELRLDFSGGNGALLNINWLDFQSPKESDDPTKAFSPPDQPSVLTGLVIPGRLEAEDFTDQSGIQKFQTTDTASEQHIGRIENGDYVLYEVDITYSGEYQFRVRYSTDRMGSVILSIDDEYIGEVFLPNTGGWEKWFTIKESLDLPAGRHTLRLEFSGSSNVGLMNINWLDFQLASDAAVQMTPTSPSGIGLTIPGRIEAENFGAQNGVSADETSDVGGGKHIGRVERNDYLLYQVNIVSGAQYHLSVRYSTPRDGVTINFSLDDEEVGNVALPNTNGWEEWTTTYALINLPVGSYVLRLDFNGSHGALLNLNWLDFDLDNQVGKFTPSSTMPIVPTDGVNPLAIPSTIN